MPDAWHLTAEEISQYASKNKKPDSGMCYVDLVLWYMLRDIYNGFRAGTLDKDTGAERKSKALAVWEREVFRIDQHNAQVDRCVELWKNVEEAASLYRKERTLQNADLMLVAIYGSTMRKDSEEQSGEEVRSD